MSGALESVRATAVAEPAATAAGVGSARQVLEIASQLGIQPELDAALRRLARGALELTGAARARVLLHDAATDTLRSAAVAGGEPEASDPVAMIGVCAVVARNGGTMHLARAAADPRYLAEVDDPDGDGQERLLLAALLGGDRRLVAVVVVARPASQADFGAHDLVAFELLASQAGPVLGQLALRESLDAAEGRGGAMQMPLAHLFRREALHAFARADADNGPPLRISPAWVSRALWLLVGTFVGALAFCVFFTVGEYASGPALVRIDGRIDLAAIAPSVVAQVVVAPGQQVEEGQVLVRFSDQLEVAEHARIEKELELQLAKRLLDPRDQNAALALTGLRADRDLAAARLAQKTLVAPAAGVVSDVRIRPGQHMPVGAHVLSIVPAGAKASIVAVLPGEYRPMLQAGQPVRFELSGFRYSYRRLRLEWIGDEVVGPEEAKRFLGPEVSGSFPLTGPVVWARAPLPESSFVSDHQSFEYYDGMHGLAEVRVRSQRVIYLLIPGLRALIEPT